MTTSVETLSKTLRGKKVSLAFAWLADLQIASGDHEGAAQTLDEGLSAHPDFVPGLMVQAKLLLQTERGMEAEPILVRILEQDPMHLAAQRNLAQVYIAQAKGNEAKSLLQSLKELDGMASNVPELPESLLTSAPESTSKLTVPNNTNELFIEKDALFASLEDAFLDEDAGATDEKSAADLRTELDAALAASPHGETVPEYFPADTPQGGDVGTLLNQMFGVEETTSKPDTEKSNSSEPLISASVPPPLQEIQTEPAASSFFTTETPAASVQPSAGLFEKASESIFSKPLVAPQASSDSLFEKASSPTFVKTEPAAPREPLAEKSKLESSSSGGTPGGVDLASALDDLFGDDDDLPVELGFNTQASTVQVEEPSEPAQAPSSDPELTQDVASALGGMFGDADDLPVENAPSEPIFEVHATENASLEPLSQEAQPESEDSAGLRTGVADALGDMFGEAEDLPIEGAPAEPSILPTTLSEEPAAVAAQEEQETQDSLGLRTGVAEALGDMFGESDDLPTENAPSEESPTEFDIQDEPTASRGATTMDEILGGTPVSSDDLSSEDSTSTLEIESLSESLFEKSAETPATSQDEFSAGVAGAFGSLFGETDELPVEQELTAFSEVPSEPESPQESPFADLLSALDEPVHHEEGAVIGGSIAASLLENPTAPIPADELPVDSATPVSSAPVAEDSFSGGMSNALTNLFGAELDEDLSDLMDDKSEPLPAATNSTKTLAELYLSQGHLRDALQVYRELDPLGEDPEVNGQIAEIQRRIDAGESEPTE